MYHIRVHDESGNAYLLYIQKVTGIPGLQLGNPQELFFRGNRIDSPWSTTLASLEINDGDVIQLRENTKNRTDEFEQTYLHHAAYQNVLEAVKVLIEAGEIDLDAATTPIGNTAIHLSTCARNRRMSHWCWSQCESQKSMRCNAGSPSSLDG